MSAVPNAIGPMSVRYAAQIRELLSVQAAERNAASEEAARQTARSRRAAQFEPPARDASEPVKVDIDASVLRAAPSAPDTDAVPVPAAQHVDIKA
ncbi:MAG: hypothetical protein SGJ21_11745 [Alphaproteobacteria bacterium]|nr:hypothetical protein [Alphaproteobacteria bacterium]